LISISIVSNAYAADAPTLGAHWQNYIAAELHRAAGVELASDAKTSSLSTEEMIQSALQREIRLALRLNDTSSLQLEVRDSSSNRFDGKSLGLVSRAAGSGISREYSPTIVQRLLFGELQAGAVFTYESFASGIGQTYDRNTGSVSRNSSGTAAQVSWVGAAASGVNLGFGYKSVTRMDAFENYRGLYSEPGRFDRPAELSTALHFKLSDDQTLKLGVDRVDYSAVAPFSSRLLPDRFVSLLGDGASPVFAWRDLTVYRASFDQRIARNSVVTLSVTSALQPNPTSDVLRAALNDVAKDYTVAFGLQHTLSPATSFKFGASYAPFDYFLGPNLLSASNDYSGSKLEAEALFEVRF
jgi:hypothetical protein